ncbi:MAG: two-component regulator propeller domain-containing protein, partial [Bacteroidota bacterium]
DPFYFHYTPIDGLPSSNIYDLYQDTTGRIWLATGNGVACYDGYEFRVIPLPPKLLDRTFVKLYPGSRGKLWLITFTGRLACLVNGKIALFPLNDSLQRWGHRYFMTGTYISPEDDIYLPARETGKVIHIDPQHQVTWIDSLSFPKNIFTSFYYDFATPSAFRPVPEDSMNLHLTGEGTLWIRNEHGGFATVHPGSDVRHEFLKNSRITRILKDREHHYWVATEGNGLLYLPSIQKNIFFPLRSNGNTNIITFDIADHQVFLSTANGKLFSAELSEGQISGFQELLNGESSKFIRSILISSSGELWLTQSKYLRYSLSGEKMPPSHIILLKYYQLFEAPDKDIYIPSREGYVVYRRGKLVYDSRKDSFYEHTVSLLKSSDGNLYLGTLNGLFFYNGNLYQEMARQYPLLSDRINVLRQWGARIVAGTASSGVVILSPDGSSFQLSQANGLKSQRVEDIFCDNDTTLWIGTDQGLIQALLFGDRTWQFRTLTIWDGLPSNEVHAIQRQGDYLWLATSNGMVSFIPEELKKSPPPPTIFFDHIVINDKDRFDPADHRFSLPANQRTLTIFFKGVCFTNHEQLSYEYKLEPHDSAWIPTRNLSARYFQLPAGTYRFLVRSKDANEIFSNSSAQLGFTIDPYFYETWYFYLIIGLLVSFLVAGSVFLVIKRIEHRMKFRTDYLWMQQKALRLQMNPHFIFNSLNSVQHFIFHHEEETAGLYLSNFSKLMRRVLENSKHNLVSLEEELSTIRLYLDLEKLRFEDKFDYRIDIDNDIEPEEIMIPPMLIQPFLENAIRHGLANKAGKGLVTLTVSKSDQVVKVNVEDDGIGMKAAAEIATRRVGHQSTGMKNIEERMLMLNKLLSRTIDLRVTDLDEQSPGQTGTRVELFIPVFHESDPPRFFNSLFRWFGK